VTGQGVKPVRAAGLSTRNAFVARLAARRCSLRAMRLRPRRSLDILPGLGPGLKAIPHRCIPRRQP